MRQITASFKTLGVTCNPLTSAILAESHLPSAQADLFDLQPLNQILTSSGQAAVR